MLVFIVVKLTRQQRGNSLSEISLGQTVLRPVRNNGRKPILRQNSRREMPRTLALHCKEPNELKIKIIVGQCALYIRGKALDIQKFLSTLIWSTDSTAYALSYPSRVYLVHIDLFVYKNLFFSILDEHYGP